MSTITLTKEQARIYLLTYHGLYGDFAYWGKEGVMSFIRRVGCIQFDPLNVVGMNPELVLQSRIRDFERSMLSDLLYQDRKLIDYWDKNMAIFPVEDWPSFHRIRQSHQSWCKANKDAVNLVLRDIENQGVVSSADLQYDQKVDWPWGPTRLARAALEGLFFAGTLGIHHKAGTRKYYDLIERLLPNGLLAAPDPFESDKRYHEWGVLRRMGSVGLLWNKPSDAWLGIRGMKSPERQHAFQSLMKRNLIKEIRIEGIDEPFFVRTIDLDVLKESLSIGAPNDRASILAPLDNLLWDRKLISVLFGFDYTWEVYKPEKERKYGYYVLPVVYGDRIVARFEPEKQRKNEALIVKNWWWEESVSVTEGMKQAVRRGLDRFAAILGARETVYPTL